MDLPAQCCLTEHIYESKVNIVLSGANVLYYLQ